MTDLTGRIFGKLQVIRRDGTDKFGNALWLCKCDCGNEVIVNTTKLKKSRVESCGCWVNPAKNRIKDLTGMVFGRLTVLEYAGLDDKSQALWKCRCSCRTEKVIPAARLKKGTSSCGCYRREYMSKKQTTHGMKNTRLYRIWSKMKSRCYDKNHMHFQSYGGRGITVCDEWKNNFILFHDWAIANGYHDNLTIDRIDNDGNYEPSNCRWANIQVQANNRRTNIMIEYQGKKQSLADWCRELNLDYSMICDRHRKNKNKTPEQLFKPKEFYKDMITYKGKTQCFKDWCQEFNVLPATARYRRKHHPEYTFEQLFAPVDLRKIKKK